MTFAIGALLALATIPAPLEHLRVGGGMGIEHGLAGGARHVFVGSELAIEATRAVEISTGGRVAFGAMSPSPRGAAFVRSSLVGRLGVFRPAVGVELELTAVPRATPRSDEPEGSLTRRFEAANDDVLRVAVVAAPARFVGERLYVSIAGLRLATPAGRGAGLHVAIAVAILDVGLRL
jgi:hypothetical protein